MTLVRAALFRLLLKMDTVARLAIRKVWQRKGRTNISEPLSPLSSQVSESATVVHRALFHPQDQLVRPKIRVAVEHFQALVADHRHDLKDRQLAFVSKRHLKAVYRPS